MFMGYELVVVASFLRSLRGHEEQRDRRNYRD